MPKASFFENTLEFNVSAPTLAHLELTIGVDNLVAQGANREIWALGNEHDAISAS
jgi:hypothetical protein